MGKYQSGQMGQTVNLLSFDFGGSNPSLPTKIAEVAQLIEHQPSKLRVASLSLVFRSNAKAACDAETPVREPEICVTRLFCGSRMNFKT